MIPRRAKVVAIGSMAASGALTLATAPLAVGVPVVAVLLGCALFVGTRNEA